MAAVFAATVLQAQEVSKIRIDPAQAYGGVVSDYFTNIEYIPLETTKESLFGTSDQLIVTDSGYVINDNHDTHSVLFFNSKGKFIKRIKEKNQNTSITIRDLTTEGLIGISTLNWDNNTWSNKRFYKNGVFIDEQLSKNRLSEKISLGKNYFAAFNSCYLARHEKNIHAVKPLIEVFKGAQLFRKYFIIDSIADLGFCKISGKITPGIVADFGNMYFAKPLTHEIYQLNKDTLIQLFQLVFPINRSVLSPGKPFPTELFKIDSLERKVRNDPKMIFEVNNVFFNRTNMFFRVRSLIYNITPGSASEQQYNFILDTASNWLVSMEHITPDEKSGFLPLTGNNTTLNGVKVHKEALYTVVSSLEMFTAREATKSRNPQYPPTLQEYFSTQNRKSNPVIVRMKLKE
ncbi:6-bladed beta-propeller [Niabella aquatica]